jgi:hypothetical protein
MSIEFFRPESQRPVDSDGFELPEWENPYFAIPPDDPAEPAAADVAWLAANPIRGGGPEPFEPSPEDWDEMARWAVWADRLDAIRSAEDAESEARARYGI